MPDPVVIEIEGPPIPKARHRYYSCHGAIVSYDPQEDAKNATRSIIQHRLRASLNSDDRKIVVDASNLTRSNEFDVEMDFYLPIAKSVPESQRNRMLWIGVPNGKPDVDNLAKFYMDCANGILWSDDKQIVSLKSKKYYSDKPRTVIKIIGRRQVDMNDKIKGVLGIFSPQEFRELTDDLGKIHESMLKIIEHVSEHGKDDNRLVITASRAALLLSVLATKCADRLKKIKTKYPNLAQEYEEYEARCKTVLHEKETDEKNPS